MSRICFVPPELVTFRLHRCGRSTVTSARLSSRIRRRIIRGLCGSGAMRRRAEVRQRRRAIEGHGAAAEGVRLGCMHQVRRLRRREPIE